LIRPHGAISSVRLVAAITEDDKQKMLWRNAARFFDLKIS
jgi:predicted TIM-barrel fold metal-dependent hydrolase